MRARAAIAASSGRRCERDRDRVVRDEAAGADQRRIAARGDELAAREALEIVGELERRRIAAARGPRPAPCRRSRADRGAAAARAAERTVERRARSAAGGCGAFPRARSTGSRRARTRRRADRRPGRPPARATCTTAFRHRARRGVAGPRRARAGARATPPSSGAVVRARSFARPQSTTTVSPNAPTRMLLGFRSRWTIALIVRVRDGLGGGDHLRQQRRADRRACRRP